jgi:excisionase family DNA binding protein
VTKQATDNSEPLTLTVAQVARKLGIARASAYAAVKSGQIASLLIGKRILIPRAALDRMLAEAGQVNKPGA